jgi:TFIIF-interacting CTD phosphatase-like protein
LIQELCKSLKREDKGTIAPWIKTYKNKKILLLDLDKTLIYYTPKTGLILRPLLNHFFRQLKGLYSIYIFTSATKNYVR